jgi:hypothetical protein
MVYNTRDYWVFERFKSSGVLNNTKTRFGNWIWFLLQVKARIYLLCWIQRMRAPTHPSLEDESRFSSRNVVLVGISQVEGSPRTP